MFLKSQLTWNIVIPAENIDPQGLKLQKAILVNLMSDFTEKQASKDLCFFLAITTLDNVGEGKVRVNSGELLFPISSSCITFKMFPGEVLEGTVHMVIKQGVFLRCGPVDKIYLSHLKMPGYHYVPGDNPFFVNDKLLKIEKGVVLRFVVLDVKYNEAGNDFQAVVSLDCDYLGPVNGTDICT